MSTNPLFRCPITHEVMVDPVIDGDGNSYERQAITEWLRKNNVSPITRLPLNINQLITNRALLDLIQSSNNSSQPMTEESLTEEEFANILNSATSLSIDIKSNVTNIKDMYNTIVNIKSEDFSKDIPLDIVIVIDTSGSMSNMASIKGNESSGLTILDIVKHATKTIIEVLNRKDRIAIVKYSNSASVILELTKMDRSGKALATSRLDTLEPDGMTNLWDGLHKALEILRLRNSRNNINSVIFLLTDGEPNVDPPKGYIPTLKNYCDKNNGKYPGVVNTFGFGYSMNSKLLEDISKECNGTYSFIPDSGFVGTIFENALANTLVTRANNAVLYIESMNDTLFQPMNDPLFETSTENISINLGNIQFGQDRNIVINTKTLNNQKPSIRCTLKYNNLCKNNLYQTIIYEKEFIDELSNDVNFHYIRQKIVLFINEIMQKSNFYDENMQISNRSKLLTLINEVKEIMKTDNNVMIISLLKDLEGQITEAIVKHNFNKWGVHYLPSLKRAHELQQCNNFKDPGVQNYGGKLFNKIRDIADDIFINKIPPPVPSVQIYSNFNSYSNNSLPTAPINMSTFNSIDNACFHGISKVTMANDNFKKVSDIVKGDLVKLGNNEIGEIECIVKTIISKPIQLNKLSEDLIITKWHPVKIDGLWKFPCEISMSSDVDIINNDSIYSFVLKNRGNGKGIIIGNIECATLGHGILNRNIISHDFFGTEKVIDNLKLSHTYESGLVILQQDSILKNDKNLAYKIKI
jgi:Mg-chelatase subunit ChlD